MNWYCDAAPGNPFHAPYHDGEYGFPVDDDVVLFERLCLEIFQAGLSWLIVLKRRESLRAAFAGFDPARVALFGEEERQRLLGDPAVIRNRRKIDAVIGNARRVQALRGGHGSFAGWLESRRLDGEAPRTKESWVALFRSTFLFMGPELVNEFLMSIGILPGAHREDCPVFGRIAKLSPPWMRE
ncbi:MAG: DNA-3-methyladenine glycosylase I [Alphaproteobacteria bacterium]|nr:DNA-3-methyladenine glycosylase I [Alphaproteobacteria bacterium]